MHATMAAESTSEARAVARWRSDRRWYHPLLAALVVRASRFVMRRMNTLTIEGRERFDALVEREGRGLLTFSNHVSLFDDPLLTSNFAPSRYDDRRWVASDAINFFGSGWKAWIFTAGKCVPVVRGAGIDQDGFTFLRDRLAEGAWVHIFPEGGRTRDPDAIMRAPFKLGIGRLIDETRPIVLPFYHFGMRGVLPIGSNRPRAGQDVRLLFGEPTSCDEAFIAATEGPTALHDDRERWEALSRWAYKELRELELRVHPSAREEHLVGVS
jgi:1-acyl-sn-glycerol-3-phosphate acyltransferase